MTVLCVNNSLNVWSIIDHHACTKLQFVYKLTQVSMCCWLWFFLFLLFLMCYSLHVAVNMCISCDFVHLYLLFYYSLHNFSYRYFDLYCFSFYQIVLFVPLCVLFSTIILRYVNYLHNACTSAGRYWVWRYHDVSWYRKFTVLVSCMPRYFLQGVSIAWYAEPCISQLFIWALVTFGWLVGKSCRVSVRVCPPGPSCKLVSARTRPRVATIGISVCLSVRPSVTRWHCVKTTQASITKSSPTDSPRTLVLAIKVEPEIPKGSPIARALNESGVGKICVFSL